MRGAQHFGQSVFVRLSGTRQSCAAVNCRSVWSSFCAVLGCGGDASAHRIALSHKNWQRRRISLGRASITACYRSECIVASPHKCCNGASGSFGAERELATSKTLACQFDNKPFPAVPAALLVSVSRSGRTHPPKNGQGLRAALGRPRSHKTQIRFDQQQVKALRQAEGTATSK
jgi:hypothetical protein